MAIISNIRLFLAALAVTSQSAQGHTFVAHPRFAQGDVSVNTDKCFAESPCHEDGRMVGEATISGDGMDKVFNSIGERASAAFANAFKNGVTVQAQLMTQTSKAHSDHHASGDVMASGERTGFIVMSDNNDAYFDYADGTSVPMEQGTLVTFEGGVPHKTVINSGQVLLAGPFDLKSFNNVGGDDCDGGQVGTGEQTFNECRVEGCAVCSREVEVSDRRRRRRRLFDSDKDEDECPTKTEVIQVCLCDRDLDCETEFLTDTANGDLLCTCGLPTGAACSNLNDCCAACDVDEGVCVDCLEDGKDCDGSEQCCSGDCDSGTCA